MRTTHASTESDAKLYQQTVHRGVEYLLTKGEQPDGSYGTRSIWDRAWLRSAPPRCCDNGRSPDDPAVAKSLKWIQKFVHDDGGIYSPDSPVKNYEMLAGGALLHRGQRRRPVYQAD